MAIPSFMPLPGTGKGFAQVIDAEHGQTGKAGLQHIVNDP